MIWVGMIPPLGWNFLIGQSCSWDMFAFLMFWVLFFFCWEHLNHAYTINGDPILYKLQSTGIYRSCCLCLHIWVPQRNNTDVHSKTWRPNVSSGQASRHIIMKSHNMKKMSSAQRKCCPQKWNAMDTGCCVEKGLKFRMESRIVLRQWTQMKPQGSRCLGNLVQEEALLRTLIDQTKDPSTPASCSS